MGQGERGEVGVRKCWMKSKDCQHPFLQEAETRYYKENKNLH